MTTDTDRRTWVESTGETEGLAWVVVANSMGHRCGYVSVPEDHPWFGCGYSDPVNPLMYADDWENHIDSKVDVHGGITFADKKPPVDGDFAEDWWFGFDCAHAGDARDPAIASPDMLRMMPTYDGEVIRTKEYVERECADLARQIVAAPTAYPFPTPEMIKAAGDEILRLESEAGPFDLDEKARRILTAGIVAGKRE